MRVGDPPRREPPSLGAGHHELVSRRRRSTVDSFGAETREAPQMKADTGQMVGPFSADFDRAITSALMTALEHEHAVIRTEHLPYGLIQVLSDPVPQILRRQGIDIAILRQRLLEEMA